MASQSIISKRLKEARIAVGLSQKQLGIAAGIDEFVASSRMNQYETGKHSPGFDMLQRIAKVLKVPSAYFYAVDNELAQLIKVYGRLDPRARQKLMKSIGAAAD